MKALTVQQPYAWAIVHGGKTIENRTTLWKYRGPLAIHAGARWSERGGRSPLVWDALRDRYGWPTGPVAAMRDPRPGFDAIRPDGIIIGVVDLTGAHPALPGCCDSPWAEREYVEAGGRTRRALVHYVLANPRPIAPVPATGRLGLWTPPPDVLDAVDAALDAA